MLQCCQPCGFPANLGLFFCGVAGCFEDLRVACFWACLIEICLFFGLVFCRFLFFRLLLFQIFWHFCCFNLLLKVILTCFCENLLILGLFFRMRLPAFLCNFPPDFLFCWIFLPDACWTCFLVKLPILGLFFKFTCLFLHNNLASLVCCYDNISDVWEINWSLMVW